MPNDLTNDISKEVKDYVDFLFVKQYIDKTTRRFLTPPNPPRTSLFYGLPKIHKPEIPLRPIVSGCDSATDNLSKYVTHFIQPLVTKLARNPNITIKPADKGGGICILNTTEYIDKVHLHLNDRNTYIQMPNDLTNDISKEVKDYVDFLFVKQYIDKTTRRFLTPPNPPRTSLFYGLPKIHKPEIPLRPIVSGCDSATDNLSKYVTHFIQPLVTKLPSYIKDTKHFLRGLRELPPMPENAFLVTADVAALYTNIPHDEGIKAVLDFIKQFRNEMPKYTPPNHVFHTLLHLILKNSFFKFMTSFYHQIKGTSMGTRMAPPYANLFMAVLEGLIIADFPGFIEFWKRFIDDIFFIFTGTELQLKKLFTHMNKIHPSIKFTFEYSKSDIPFLDTRIYIDQSRKLQTTLFRKPTDRMMLLHYSSEHPHHVKASIVYTQALRYCTIISNDQNLEKELYTLARTFLARGYPLNLLIDKFSKALNFLRNELLEPVMHTHVEEITPLITPFSPVGMAQSRIIHKHWSVIEKNETLKSIWPSRPLTAYTRGKSLRDTLVKSAQKPL
ncbi:uncharacterized protein LOC130628918 [Hydractinia symbiolongicarpus]|uniref:uncharacterized protein LOC130628918 n=1 Tax=Hydractinia symbiolongicarpus TaxID=13093 RepID=UPI00254EA358|nr:uncharacterized protein LOC130628918 [Hydractinia symbiolongicarpus]